MSGEWTAAAYAALYDRVVDGFAPYETLVDSVASLIERLHLADGRRAPCRILDVTCGTGSVVRRLAARGHVVVGVDPVAPLVERARRASRRFSTCSFHAVDVAREDVPATGSFDAVVSMHTLYWHPEPARVLDACRRALRPGGHAIVLTYTRPAAVFPVARAVWRAEGIRAALQSLRWLLPTAAFELARGGPHRYLAPGELAGLLLERGLEPLGSCPAFLDGISQLTWSRRTACAAGATSARLPARAQTSMSQRDAATLAVYD
jgi:SAM-dependent methyltransferase